ADRNRPSLSLSPSPKKNTIAEPGDWLDRRLRMLRLLPRNKSGVALRMRYFGVRHPPRILILSSAAAEPRRVSKDAPTSCSASTISARRAASGSDSSAIDQRETGDVVGLLGAGGKFGGGSDDFLDELSGADAPLAIEDCFEPRFAKNVSGRVERLGDAVGEHEQRVAGSEHGFGDGVRAVGVDAERDAGRFQQVAAAAGAQQIGRVVAGIAVAQPAGFEIEHAGEHRHKHAGGVAG